MTRFAPVRALFGAALILASTASARQSLVVNGSMEKGAGLNGPDYRYAGSWVHFGGTSSIRDTGANLEPPWACASLKFWGSSDVNVGAYQNVPVAPGEQVMVSVYGYTRSGDKLGGDGVGYMELGFYTAADQPIGSAMNLPVIEPTSPADTWLPGAIGPVAAPSGAAYARLTLGHSYGAQWSGSVFFDDAQMSIDDGDNVLINGDIETPTTTLYTPYGIEHWSGFGRQYKSDDYALHGTWSARVEAGNDTGSSFSGVYQDSLDLVEGDHILVKGMAYNPEVGGLSADARAGIKLEFRPPANLVIPPAEENLAIGPDETQMDTWIPVTLSTVVPADITQAKIIVLAFENTASNGPIYADNMSAILGSAPGVNQLQNNSFESGFSTANGMAPIWNEFRDAGAQARKNAFEVPGQAGTNVLKISGTGTAGVIQTLEVVPGETLNLSGYFRQRSAQPFNTPGQTDPNQFAYAGLKVEWVAGSVPAWVDIVVGQPNTLTAANAPAGQWTPVSVDYTMAAGTAALARVTCINGNYSSLGVVTYFDNYEAVVLNRFDGADFDADNDEDLADVAELQWRFTGSTTGLPWGGIVFDHNDDQKLDSSDWSYFGPYITGPSFNVPNTCR